MQNPSRHSQATPSWIWWLIAVPVLAILFVAGYILATQVIAGLQTNAAPESGYTGVTVIDPPRPMPDFALTDQNGELLQWSDLRGKYVLFAFGFTNCPDICPLTLSEFRRVRDGLAENAQEVQFVFISVDGERDTPQVLADYFRVRNLEGFIGLTGDPEQVRTIGENYGLYFSFSEKDAQGRYNVDHTAGSYLIDREGRWVARFAYGTDMRLITEEIAARLMRDR